MADDATNVNTVQETSEVILPPGGTTSTAPALHDIFSRIESAKSEGRTAKEAIADTPPPEEKKEEKKEEVKPEPKTEEVDLSKRLDAVAEKKEEDAEISRDKLKAATEEKKVEEKKVEAKVEEKKEDEVPEEELKVLSTDKPKTAKRIQALLKRSATLNTEFATTKAEKEALAKERDDLKKQLEGVKTVDPATDAKVKEQLSELAMYRRRYDLDKDPEIKTKYDARVEAAEQSITSILTARNAGERLLKEIKAAGGWAKFASSTRLLPVNDDEGGTKSIPASDVADLILQNLPLGERKALESAMMEQISTAREKDRFLKEQQDSAAEYFKKREEETTRQTEEHKKNQDAATKQIDEWAKKTLDADWLQDKTPDPKATLTEKAAIDEYNKYNGQLRTLFKKAIATHDLPGLMEIMTDSVRYYEERRVTSSLRGENAKLKADLAAKQAEIDRFKGAGRSVPRAGSITSTSSSETSKNTAPRDISDAFDRIGRGESVVLSSREEE
jgi:hypothetical protein